jgi:hypothetical protein
VCYSQEKGSDLARLMIQSMAGLIGENPVVAVSE